MVSKFVLLFIILNEISKGAFSQEPDRAILQGKLARLGQFPYVVVISNNPVTKHSLYKGTLCTGSILTELWVVTAYHCYNKYPRYKINLTEVTTVVIAGSLDYERNTTYTQHRISGHHVMMDKNYHKKAHQLPDLVNNDVLILKVTEPFVFNEYVGPVAIAKRPLPEGQELTCTVVGYGLTEAPTLSNKGQRNSKLYYTYATLDGDKFSCRKRAQERRDPSADYWGEEHICVDPVNHKSTPCHGDSGGPLMCEGLDIGTSIGRRNIYNSELHCGAKGNYHVYTFLGFYEDWLKKHIPKLPTFKNLEAQRKHGSTSGGGNARNRLADIGLVLFIGRTLLHLQSSIR